MKRFPVHLRIAAPALVLSLCSVPLLYSQQTTPTVMSVSTGSGGTTNTNIARGGIFTITGLNLAQAAASVTSLTNNALPVTLGGTQVTIGGIQAPLFMVSPTMIQAQAPFEVAAGSSNLVVTNGTMTSAAATVNIAEAAPALFSDSGGVLVQKAADYTRVGPANPARADDILIFYATGLGQTSPVGLTGVATGTSGYTNTQPVNVIIGGQPATVLYSVASPGFVGLDQIAIQVTADMQGSEPIVIRQGSSSSTAVSLVSSVGRASQLDPQVQAVYTQLLGLGPRPIDSLSPQVARMQPSFADGVKALLQAQGKSTAPMPVGSVMDTTVPGGAGPIPARVYTPAGAGPFPVIVYFHGGGFVIATIDTYDASARALANAAGAVVISVEYRKAPENRFPAAVEDAYAATQYVMNNAGTFNGITAKVAVAGESAGGNLATVVCMLARDRMGKMPVYQGLVYPVADFSSTMQSNRDNAMAPFLTQAALVWFGDLYLNTPQDALNPYASPALGSVAGLPAATVISAGYDPLRDQVAAYASKLKLAGVTVDYRNYAAESHEFFGMGAVVDAARQANQQMGANLKAAFDSVR